MTVLDESPRDLSASGINLSVQRVAATCKDRPVIVALLAGDVCHLAFIRCPVSNRFSRVTWENPQRSR